MIVFVAVRVTGVTTVRCDAFGLSVPVEATRFCWEMSHQDMIQVTQYNTTQRPLRRAAILFLWLVYVSVLFLMY